MKISAHEHIVIGAGISGLTLTLEMQEKSEDVLLLEAGNVPGGVLQSVHEASFTWDRAAHTIAIDQEVAHFFEKYGLTSKLIQPSSVSRNRQIAIDDKLWAVSNNPIKILGAKYLSLGSKFTLIRELFRKPIPIENPTVFEFFSHHFGEEITKNLVSAVFSGIYAGDIEKMEMTSVMPKILEIERESGSLIRGLIKNKAQFQKRTIYGVAGGMEEVGKTLSSSVKKVSYNQEVERIKKVGGKYHLVTPDCTYVTPSVISTIPAYRLQSMLQEDFPALSKFIGQIHYEPMVLIHIGFRNLPMEVNLEAFGFLCSQYDYPHLRGALFNSDLFRDRAKKGEKAYTLFMKPSREALKTKDVLAAEVSKTIKAFKELTKIEAEEVLVKTTVWPKGIPQFNRPYAQLKEAIKGKIDSEKGLHLSGSFMSGVSIPDCIKFNIGLAQKITS